MSYKREKYRGHYATTFRDSSGKVVARDRWGKQRNEDFAVKRSIFESRSVEETLPSQGPSAPIHTAPSGQSRFGPPNLLYDELVFYATDENDQHLYFIEIRMRNVILSRNASMDDIIDAVRLSLMKLARGRINRIKVDMSDRCSPTTLPETHNGNGLGIKKNAMTKQPWHQESFNISF